MAARILCTALLRQASRRTAAAAIEGQQLLRLLPPALPQAVHRFSSSSAPADLAKVLQDELSHEQGNYEKSEVVAGGPPAPFLLEQQPEDTLLTLKRKYKDEDVVVSVSDNLQVRPRPWRGAAGAAGAPARAGRVVHAPGHPSRRSSC